MPRHPSFRTPSRALSAKLAGAILLLSGLTGTALADATWVGDTSQDWNNAANWSSDPANPSGNFIVNTATAGVFPVLNATSAFSPVDLLIGVGTGLTGRLDVTGGSVSTGSGNWLILGRNGGNGTVNVSNATVTTQDLRLGSTENTGTGTVNVNAGGTLNALGMIALAAGNDASDTVVGTVNVNTGGTVSCEFDLHLAFAGNSSTVGTVNIASGGTLSVGTGTKRWVIMSEWDSTRGVINVNGGTLNLNANTDIQFSIGSYSPGASNGASTITLNSGAINMGASSVINLNNNADRAVNHNINLNGGTFTIGSIVSSKLTGTRAVNFNGGTLRAAGTNAAFIGATATSALNVLAGGARIDSNGFDITIAKALTTDSVSTGGGLVKLGAGALTLTGVNTYTGNTTVSDGSLVLADNASLKFVIGATGVSNKVTGTGSVTLDGDFDFDLTAAGTTVGNSWQIVDISTLSETFGSNFSVSTFTLESGKWIKPANGAFYQFDTATGVLRVINNPGVTFPPPTVNLGAHRDSYVLGSDFTLSVSATGTGNLTYQWYYKADSGATATPISGATQATLSITGATAGSGGIYSVVVTDDAAPTTPTTTAFPAISVLPGTAFTVAYYRFEDGTANATITTTADSSAGASTLTALGTPNYAEDSLPYTVIPRTGAANTLGANFPATGNQGLIAPTTGALASAEFLDFTIEAFVRLDSLSGWQTIVGRDDSANPGQGGGAQSLFYLSKAGGVVGSGLNNAFRIELIDRSGVNLQVNSQTVPTVGTWYHVAAVGDAAKGTLTLYVNGVAVSSTTGFTGLAVPTAGSDTPWTLGRGDYGFADVDYLRGDLDEVRFSSAALPPKQFLASTETGFVLPPVITQAPANQTLRLGTSTTLSVTATGGTFSYEWYKNEVLISGQTGSTLALNAVTAGSEGTYRVKVINTAGTSLGADISTSASAVIRVLDVNTSARSLGLNFSGASSGGNFSTVAGELAPSATAGFVPAANWNNSTVNVANQTTPLTLVERNGATPAYTTATWSAAGTWAARSATGNPALGEKTPDATLLHGYIESRAATGTSVSLSDIPYGTYDVYVYVMGGNNTANVGSLTLNHAGSPTYYYRPFQNDFAVPATTPTALEPYSIYHVIGDSTTSAAALTAPPATFVRFTGVTGTALTITAIDATLAANAGGIAAVQIVDTTPAGSAYPPTVTTAPVSVLRTGGASATFSVVATSNNSGGSLSYQWQKDGVNIGGQTSAILSLTNVTSADSANYTVVVTDTSSLGTAFTTKSASLVVVDANRSLLINGDINTASSPTYVGDGILRANGTQDYTTLEAVPTVWNGILGGADTATRVLAKESTGLGLSGITFTYTGATGVESDTTSGGGVVDPAMELEQDYLYAAATNTAPLTGTVGGLQALSGKQVTLLVYAIGKTVKAGNAYNSATVNDTANVSLATANNYLNTATGQTSVFGIGSGDDAGRDIERNNPMYSGGLASSYVAFTGVVAADGTVTWSLTPDTSAAGGGLVPLVGFQLLVTATDIAPPVPTGLAAVAGNNQVALSWTASSGAQTYTIKRATAVGGPYTTISAGSVTGTSHTDSTAVGGTTYYYTVASVNALAQSADSAPVSATPTGATALQSWRQSHFGITTDSGPAANSADPDGDGLINLLEYAVGSDPTVSSTSPVVLGRSGSFLTLAFTPVVDASLHYVVEASSDLTGVWATAHDYGSFATATPTTYTDTVALGAATRRFLRLKVTLAP